MKTKQLGTRIRLDLHIRYFAHAIRMGKTLTDWVVSALANQYKEDKLKKK